MTIDIKAPAFPESVADGTIATWHKQPGEAVARDELIVDIETDKVVLEIVAPADGVISEIIKVEGDTVLSEELIGKFEAGAAASASAALLRFVPSETAQIRCGNCPYLTRSYAWRCASACLMWVIFFLHKAHADRE